MALQYMASPVPDRELKKGSAELMILALLEDRARHGYEIGQLIELRLTASGKNVLSKQRAGWREFVEAINLITGIQHA